MYRGSSITPTTDFPSETMQDQRQWDDLFKGPNISQKVSDLLLLRLQ
jgi:hypothetical protein